MSVDSSGLENNTRHIKTLVSAIDKFKKYNLDALVIINQAPGQALFDVVERRLSPMAHDLAGLILPHDYFGTHLNDAGLTEHAELEKENFKLTGDVLAEVWSMNVLDEYPVIAKYIKPSLIIDEKLQMADSTLALYGVDSVGRLISKDLIREYKDLVGFFRICADVDGGVLINQTHSSTTILPTIKTECEIDE